MGAKDYNLCVSGLSGRVFISKVSKKNKHQMLDDRIEISKHDFVTALLGWTKHQLDENEDTVYITADDKVIAEIKIIEK